MAANINNVIGGHKAALARDNVSEEAKEVSTWLTHHDISLRD